MRRKSQLVVASLLCALVAPVLGSQVAADQDYNAANFVLVNGIIEGPDPIPTDWDDVLQSMTGGELPDFGSMVSEPVPGDLAISPLTGFPLIVWSYQTGSFSSSNRKSLRAGLSSI